MKRYPLVLLTLVVLALVLSGRSPYDRTTWGGHSAEAFLGTQGDVWDTQWDMFLALIGAMTAQLALAKVHDRALRAVANETNAAAGEPTTGSRV